MNNFTESRPIAPLTTFGIGGPARWSIDVKSIEEMQEAIQTCNENKLPFFILGKGSNCLFDDQGLNAVLIVNKIDFVENTAEGLYYVGAGHSFSHLGTITARNGFSGLEFASGIPGSVGGAVFMNAGANGHDTCETLVDVDFIDAEGRLRRYKKEELEFTYRHSSFHAMKGAIVAATFQLKPEEGARAKQIQIITYRKNTQPYGDKSAGCIFQNPAEGFAGALIDKAGLKGVRVGGAEVSLMHGNFIVNREGATCKDVLELIGVIQHQVKDKLGINLEYEVRHIPYNWGAE